MTRPKWWSRFWSKVRRTRSCWLWMSDLDTSGYGRFWLGRNAIAHKVLWEHYNGPVPVGVELMHVCDVKQCVRPSHLETGAHLRNMEDASRRDRITGRRLTVDAAVRVLERHRAGDSLRTIADDFGVSFWNVRDVARGKTFRWLQAKG